MKPAHPLHGAGDPAGGFPGEIAGASLKHAVRGAGRRRRDGFPGEIAGASLKRADRRVGDARRPRRFPGEIAGASLKRPRGPVDHVHQGGIPRRNRRGLIEARYAEQPGGEVVRRIPRRNRRGLIEAATSRRRRRSRPWIPRRNRRGLIEASASRRPSTSPRGRIPRRNRRGLIEASSAAMVPSTSPVGFPGEIAGASLKPVDTADDRAGVDAGFPGEIAGASLKRPRYVRRDRGEERVDSPAKSPGPH